MQTHEANVYYYIDFVIPSLCRKNNWIYVNGFKPLIYPYRNGHSFSHPYIDNVLLNFEQITKRYEKPGHVIIISNVRVQLSNTCSNMQWNVESYQKSNM
jgi:hypothetical protein